MNKPLTRLEREQIDAFIESSTSLAAKMLAVAMKAEIYWRDAVKNAAPNIYFEYGEPYPNCPFCGESAGVDEPRDHKPDCPWKLAQDD